MPWKVIDGGAGWGEGEFFLEQCSATYEPRRKRYSVIDLATVFKTVCGREAAVALTGVSRNCLSSEQTPPGERVAREGCPGPPPSAGYAQSNVWISHQVYI
jgi:hypothetical protein